MTGAARVALGPEVQAFFCDDDDVARTLQETGAQCGDPLWRLPLWRPYRKLIDGQCADLNNVAPTPFAGSIIGALYLAEFVSRSTAWVHVDLMASNTKARRADRKVARPPACARSITTSASASRRGLRNRLGGT